MGIWFKNDRKRLADLASARARDTSEPVLIQISTEGAVNLLYLSPPAPRKPDGMLRISRKNLGRKFSRVKMTSVYESTA